MRIRVPLVLVFCFSMSAGVSAIPRPQDTGEAKWFKGNTHTHTLWSDGDSTPEAVADWYRSRGYHFLVLSDHNILSQGEKWVRIGDKGKGRVSQEEIALLKKRFGEAWSVFRNRRGRREMRLKTLPELRKHFEKPNEFIFIQGEEISDRFEKKPIHHNSMNHTHLIKPPHGKSVRDILKRTIAAVNAEARRTGRPVLVHLNHPNFGWGVSPDDIAHVLGERFFEVYNGHSGVRNYGDRDHKSMEDTWDYVLSLRLGKLGGKPLFGLATDDAHNFFHAGRPTAAPGRGWIMVRAKRLDANTITRAMLRGDFYATSGVLLDSIESNVDRLTVKVAVRKGVRYRIRFVGTRIRDNKIGKVGELLKEVSGAKGSYRYKGDELYVRATVVSDRQHPNGYRKDDRETAWTQPVVVRRR